MSNKKYIKIINKDGEDLYLHAEKADTLVATKLDNTASYTIRPAAGDTQGVDNEIESGVAELAKIEGNRLAWNQLAVNGDFSDGTTGWIIPKGSVSVSNKIVTATCTKAGEFGFRRNVATAIAGHKYLIIVKVKGDKKVLIGNGGNYMSVPASSDFTTVKDIRQAAVSTSFEIINSSAAVGDTIVLDVNVPVQLIDLSLIYGLGNEPATVEEAEARLAALTPAKPYYQYNAGELYGVKKLYIVSYGQNLLNPANGQARLAAYSYGDSSNKYGIKAKEGDTFNTISFTPDATGVAVSVTPDANGLFTIPSAGTLNVTMSSGSLANAYVWAVWDGSKDGINNYKPYEESALEIKVSEIYGKLNGAGEYVQVFPNGMRGAGSVRDMIDLAKAEAVVNVGVNANLNNCVWEYSADRQRFETGSLIGIIKGASANAVPANILSNLYSITNTLGTLGTTNNMVVSESTGGYLHIKNLSKDASAIDESGHASFLSGVVLWYELATPAHYTDLKIKQGNKYYDLPTTIAVDNWGIEEQYPSDTPATGKDFTGVAAQVTATYQKNVAESIESQPEEYASLSSLKRKADKAYGAAGNVAVLDGNGNYEDSGVSVDEIVTSEDITPADITGASYTLVLDSALDNYTNKGIYAVTYHPTSPAGKVVKTMLVVNEAATPVSSPTSFTVYQTILEENGKIYRRSRIFTDAGHTTGGSWSEWENVNAYTLPTASSNTLGGVKVGDGLSISNGVLSCDHTQIANDEDENARVKCGFDNNGGNIELYVENGSGTSKSATITYDNIDRLLGSIPVVANSSGTTLTLDPNKLYVITRSSVSNLGISLGTAISGVVNEYHCIIKITSMNVPNVTWPSTIKWVGGSAPTLEGFRDYEISILNNIGVFTWVSNQQQAQPIS